MKNILSTKLGIALGLILIIVAICIGVAWAGTKEDKPFMDLLANHLIVAMKACGVVGLGAFGVYLIFGGVEPNEVKSNSEPDWRR